MSNNYKLILSNKWIYREIELSEEGKSIQIGTRKGCSMRFSREYFFDDFVLLLDYVDDKWIMSCADTSYILMGNEKMRSIALNNGDEFRVCFCRNNKEIFNVFCILDSSVQDFSRQVNLVGISQCVIGGNSQCNIFIDDPILRNNVITLVNKNDKWFVVDNNNHYGVYINGKKVNGSIEVNSYDFISFAGYNFYFKKNILFMPASQYIEVNGLEYKDDIPKDTCFEYPKYNRNTRIKYVIPTDDIEVLNPPAKPEKSKKSILFRIIPAVVSIALVVVLRGIMSGSRNNMFILYSACTMTVGLIVTIVSYFDDKKIREEELREREEKYMEYINDKEREIMAARDNELRIRRMNQPNIDEDIQEVFDFGKRLFEKDIKDEDFLDVYLGLGRVEASRKVKVNKKEFIDNEDELSLIPEKMFNRYEYIYDAPIVVKVADNSSMGVVGDYVGLCDMLKNFTMDIVTRHYYKEVKLYYLFEKESGEKFSWVRWLPHVYNEQLNIKNIIIDEESQNLILDYLYSKLSQRKANNIKKKDSDKYEVVMVFGVQSIKKHPISKFIENASEYGTTFIFFDTREEMLPKGCGNIVKVRSQTNSGQLWNSEDGDNIIDFSYRTITSYVASKVAKRLSPIYIDEVGVESELKKKISMYELLHVNNIEEFDLAEIWSTSKVYESMSVPLGVKRKDEVVFLDISDNANAHGPHGLVAGTTGSGKSEILQSYVLSMALKFNPYDVAFMIIDFKGGGMANQFKDLPHLLGTITNIDGREINRSLLSIKAELIKRQEIFSQSGVNHINGYIKLFKQGKVKKPLPHLIIIVDEFAELKAEYPDFMKEVVSAARIGRTLGIHLILATQKPAGIVDNQIWSNSKFKLCLKVQTKEDSTEVIKNPLAAEIVEPGRAYFQVGNNEMFELFQSAYSGEKVMDSNAILGHKYEISMLNVWGKKHVVYSNKGVKGKEESLTQLQAIVNYIDQFCYQQGIGKLPGICLPPLEDVIYNEEVPNIAKNVLEGIKIPIGIYDDPAQQKQGPYEMNLSYSNTYIIGSAQTGKTTLLQTMIYEIMEMYTPNEVNMYVIDCGNMTLKVFEGSNHVGGVVLVYEEERIKNLFKLINTFIKERKDKFSKIGLSNYRAYVEAGYYDLPQIILMIDNYDAFKDYYVDLLDEILILSREGQSVGVNLVITATHTNTISYKALTNFANRIAYICNDVIEYSNLLTKPKIQPKDVPGRALGYIDKQIVEFQTMMCVRGDKEITRVENIKAFIETNSRLYSNMYARFIPEVPEIIRRSLLLKRNPQIYLQPYVIPVGIGFESVEYVNLYLLSLGMFAVSGKAKSGKKNFTLNILDSLAITRSFTQTFLFDSADGRLSSVVEHPCVAKYTTDEKDFEKYLDIIEQEMENRKNLIKERGREALNKKSLIMIIIENEKVLTLLKNDAKLAERFKQMYKNYKSYKLFILCSNIENAAISFSSSPLLKDIKEVNNYMIFEEIQDIKLVATTMKQQREEKKELSKGDGFLVLGGKMERIRTILKD